MASRWRAIAGAALADPGDGPTGSGLVALGGFAFAADGGESEPWSGFAPASLVVPEISLASRSGHATVTVNLELEPGDTAADVLERVGRRLGELRNVPLPLVDPAPTGAYRVQSSISPAHSSG